MGATVRGLTPATFLFEDETRRVVFHCVRAGDVVFVHWDGRAYEIRDERESARAAQRAATGSLEAPMPGKVIKLSATVGQPVKKGQEILVVEAMKMENQIRAPKDGRVTRLAAKVGDMVGPGMVLAEIE
jgi:biotin carboxyl carrier protein